MATKTLLMRPYIISASRINLFPIIHQIQSTTKPYSTIVVSISSRIASKSICSSSSVCTKSHHIGTRNGNLQRMFATIGNGSGSIDSPLIQSMESKIKEQLNAELVSVKDANGDGRHVSIDVISASFEGQSAVNRQRMVYKAIWEELQNTVHAVDQMTTKTPAEAATQK